jgi:hypothetical protein
MSACYALIETLQAARLINRLCKHWGHKFEVTLNEQEGEIILPMGKCRLLGSETQLRAELEGDAESMSRFQEVVADHLQRMDAGSNLVIEWQDK